MAGLDHVMPGVHVFQDVAVRIGIPAGVRHVTILQGRRLHSGASLVAQVDRVLNDKFLAALTPPRYIRVMPGRVTISITPIVIPSRTAVSLIAMISVILVSVVLP
jgi:hypothetical protein